MSTDAFDRYDAVRPMGAPTDIATKAAKEFRQRRFASRHPIVAFVLLPVVVLPLLWIGTIMAFVLFAKLVGFGEGGGMTTEQLPVWIARGLASVVFGMVLAPLGLAAWYFCRLARKAEMGRRWPLAACLLLAVIGSAAYFDVALPGTNQHGLLHDTRFRPDVLEQNTKHGSVTMGFGLGIRSIPKWWQIAQFALPMAIGGWAVCRQFSSQRQRCAT